MREQDREREIAERLTYLETHMTRLVGETGDTGIVAKIEKHLEKMEKLVQYGFVIFIIDSGLRVANGAQVLTLLKELFLK